MLITSLHQKLQKVGLSQYLHQMFSNYQMIYSVQTFLLALFILSSTVAIIKCTTSCHLVFLHLKRNVNGFIGLFCKGNSKTQTERMFSNLEGCTWAKNVYLSRLFLLHKLKTAMLFSKFKVIIEVRHLHFAI